MLGVDCSAADMPAAACRNRFTSVSRGVADRNVAHDSQAATCFSRRTFPSGVSLPRAKAANCRGVGCDWLRVSICRSIFQVQ